MQHALQDLGFQNGALLGGLLGLTCALTLLLHVLAGRTGIGRSLAGGLAAGAGIWCFYLLARHMLFPAPQAHAIVLIAALAPMAAAALVSARLCWGAVRLAARNSKFDTALSNMGHGLCMFDAAGRLVLANDRYRALYDLTPADLRPGTTLQDLLQRRRQTGSFPLNPDSCFAGLGAALASAQVSRTYIDLPDGRVIEVVNRPMDDGGWVATHEDVTARRRAERELDRVRSFLDTVIENIPVTVTVRDASDHRYVLINRAGEELYGLPREEVIGRHASELFSQPAAAIIDEHNRASAQAGEALIVDVHAMEMPRRGRRLVTVKRIAIPDTAGAPQYLVSVVEDVTEHQQAEAKIAHMAFHDTLTGLPNRAAFIKRLYADLDAVAAVQGSLAVICLDLERFKEINDALGPAGGDALLRQVAQRLEAAAEGAFVARVGGDEFNIICADGEQPDSVEALAERLSSALAGAMPVDGQDVPVALSMGVAVYPCDSTDAATLLAHADAALSLAKVEARGSIRFFRPDMDCEQRERRALHNDLRLALARNECELHYQPQTAIDGSLTGFEALVRWHHLTRGLVSPARFIPVAEETGLIAPLGEWILREACREAASWPRPLNIAVNLSPAQFLHGDLPAMVMRVLAETGLSPPRLELEITESVLIGDRGRAIGLLRRLKALGVRIAMDDFGTGYSSLSYLQTFPIDKIKIDQSFVANLPHSPPAAAIVRAVIGLGRGLGLPVVAEGVETQAQLDFLAREGCSELQGYLLGQPRPIADYAAAIGRSGPNMVEKVSSLSVLRRRRA